MPWINPRCFDDLRRCTEGAIAGAFRTPAEARAAEAAVAALPLPETCLTHYLQNGHGAPRRSTTKAR